MPVYYEHKELVLRRFGLDTFHCSTVFSSWQILPLELMGKMRIFFSKSRKNMVFASYFLLIINFFFSDDVSCNEDFRRLLNNNTRKKYMVGCKLFTMELLWSIHIHVKKVLFYTFFIRLSKIGRIMVSLCPSIHLLKQFTINQVGVDQILTKCFDFGNFYLCCCRVMRLCL